MSPDFLDLDDALRFHRDQIAQYGGSLGVRDLGLLESALAMPRQGFGGNYVHSDIFEMAAAYLFHIVKNHPFVDGNKRVGAFAAIAFLKLNGVEPTAPNEALVEMVLSVAEGRLAKSGVAEFFRRHRKPRTGLPLLFPAAKLRRGGRSSRRG